MASDPAEREGVPHQVHLNPGTMATLNRGLLEILSLDDSVPRMWMDLTKATPAMLWTFAPIIAAALDVTPDD